MTSDVETNTPTDARRTVRLRVLLVIAITGLVLIGIIGATLLHIHSFRDHMRSEVNRTIGASVIAVQNEAEALLMPVSAIIDHVRHMPPDMITGRPGSTDGSRFDRFFESLELVSSLQTRVDAVYLGFPDGSSAFIGRNTPALRGLAELPDDSKRSRLLRYVRNTQQDRPVDHWLWRAEEGWVGAERQHMDYDPRERPWYELGENSRDPVWTPPYRSIGDHSLDLTLAYGLRTRDGGLAAVLGIDIRLDDLVAFVSQLDVSPNGFAFIAKRNGELLAHPELNVAQVIEQNGSGEVTLFSVKRSNLYDVRLFEAFSGTELTELEIQHQGETIVGRRLPLTSFFGLDAEIYIGAPLSDFTSASEEVLASTLVLTGVATLIVLFAGILISRAIARPIDSAVHAMQALSQLENLEPTVPARSALAEIDTLNGTVELMRTALRSFSHYVPVEIVRELLEQRQSLTLGGRRREITILFTDIEGFTQLTETEQHETMIAALGDYFDIMCGTITKHGGTIDKFIGDSIMAFWGAPRDDVDQSTHACDAVVEMLERLEAFNSERLVAGQPALKTRFAMHRGYAFVGNVGARERFSYTAIGDVVNAAARIESLAKKEGSSVLASRAVVGRVGERHKFTRQGMVELRGKRTSLEVFELQTAEMQDNADISLVG